LNKQVAAMRILVVEDDDDCSELLSEIFRDRGHSVETCRQGMQALERLPHFRPDVALVDVGLPDMTGYELAPRLRVLVAATCRLRLIALTGYGGDAERERAREAGFDEYYVKPVHPDVLVQAVEAVDVVDTPAKLPVLHPL